METREKLFNDSKTDITNFFKQGKSFFTTSRNEAIEKTKKRGYFYEVFDEKGRHLGYGVPK